MNTQSAYEHLVEETKAKQKALQNEEYQVVIKLPSLPNILRLTYSKRKNGRLVGIEELDAAESVISSGTFKGIRHQGNLPFDVLNLKPLINSIKVQDWIYNQDVWIDEYYKKH
jgi:hypothetical protein